MHKYGWRKECPDSGRDTCAGFRSGSCLSVHKRNWPACILRLEEGWRQAFVLQMLSVPAGRLHNFFPGKVLSLLYKGCRSK